MEGKGGRQKGREKEGGSEEGGRFGGSKEDCFYIFYFSDFSLCEIQFYVPEVGQLEELKDKLKNIGDAEQSDEEVLVQMHDLSFNIPRYK